MLNVPLITHATYNVFCQMLLISLIFESIKCYTPHSQEYFEAIVSVCLHKNPMICIEKNIIFIFRLKNLNSWTLNNISCKNPERTCMASNHDLLALFTATLYSLVSKKFKNTYCLSFYVVFKRVLINLFWFWQAS